MRLRWSPASQHFGMRPHSVAAGSISRGRSDIGPQLLYVCRRPRPLLQMTVHFAAYTAGRRASIKPLLLAARGVHSCKCQTPRLSFGSTRAAAAQLATAAAGLEATATQWATDGGIREVVAGCKRSKTIRAGIRLASPALQHWLDNCRVATINAHLPS